MQTSPQSVSLSTKHLSGMMSLSWLKGLPTMHTRPREMLENPETLITLYGLLTRTPNGNLEPNSETTVKSKGTIVFKIRYGQHRHT